LNSYAAATAGSSRYSIGCTSSAAILTATTAATDRNQVSRNHSN
jgi:hypothetical protein